VKELGVEEAVQKIIRKSYEGGGTKSPLGEG